ncbi:hypothetical protein JCM18901_1422 [Psychrobacter sp. JCM 18901]|uniref:DUF3015 family protein n=1 Tax=Psychrobacter sp. JCM 18901 TaxID=1298609 RepID=UPI0004323839|nr:DUF3015 family protein [Psychrobacter sp. JCM 18901]GAF55755.1 hypothetical protein JCM18901_1422 [Psychrobacter sp. JCM 18901]
MIPFSAANADLGSKFKTAETGRTIEQIYKQCGIGGALFGNSSPILAIISNVTWDLGTTAATSDSMSPETCQGGNVRAAVLIKEAFPSVEKDLASGQGAHLSAYKVLLTVIQPLAYAHSMVNILRLLPIVLLRKIKMLRRYLASLSKAVLSKY